MDYRNFFIPVAASPAVQAILQYICELKLTPFAHWEWMKDFALPITYIVAIGAAAVASLLIVKRNHSKAIVIATGIIFLFSSVRLTFK